VFEGPGQGKNQGEAGAAAPGETIGYQTRFVHRVCGYV
jgi:hypothetical protein